MLIYLVEGATVILAITWTVRVFANYADRLALEGALVVLLMDVVHVLLIELWELPLILLVGLLRIAYSIAILHVLLVMD